MECWTPTDPCTCGIGRPDLDKHGRKCPFPATTWRWVPMDAGPGSSVWRPRRTAQEAAQKCLEWTGLTGIPTMRVIAYVDPAGTVVWQWGARCTDDADPGPEVLPGWHPQIVSAVRMRIHERAADTQPAVPEPVHRDTLF